MVAFDQSFRFSCIGMIMVNKEFETVALLYFSEIERLTISKPVVDIMFLLLSIKKAFSKRSYFNDYLHLY